MTAAELADVHRGAILPEGTAQMRGSMRNRAGI